nr:aldehyde dehydrogenase family protein [uncultured Lichenicoccus sp.]
MYSETFITTNGTEFGGSNPAAPDRVQDLVEKARIAQAVFETLPQAHVDAIVREFGKYVYCNAEALAGMAHRETGLGVYEDKVQKKKAKSRTIWNSLKDKKSRGVIEEDVERNLVLIAKPMGVVGAVCPITNPIVTPMCNAMFALKAGNAIIFAPHFKAQAATRHLVSEYERIVREHGGPASMVQTIESGSRETTQMLMRSVDVVVATGGGSLVKAAYSSGKPSFGVGVGNVPVVIDRGVDLCEAALKIVAGAAFDNGIICSHEQFVLAPRESYQATIDAFMATGDVWFTSDATEIERLRTTMFRNGHIDKAIVGQSAQFIGARAGLDVPASARIILVPADGAGTLDLLAKEKLCPVVAILAYDSFEDAIRKAGANLLVEGAGHSAALHSHDEENIRAMGLALPISRLVVNQTSSLTAGGSLSNGFAPTTTLGCGSWGGNSISENLDYKHLMNVSRVGRVIAHRSIPTDDEIWAA